MEKDTFRPSPAFVVEKCCYLTPRAAPLLARSLSRGGRNQGSAGSACSSADKQSQSVHGSFRFLNENGTLSTLFLSDKSDSSPASPPPGGGRNVNDRMIDNVVPVRLMP